MGIESVCIVGMGTMGSQIGVVCARAGFKTLMVDVSTEQAAKGTKSIPAFLEAQEKKGKIDKASADTCLSRISTATNMEKALSRADLMIEAVFEDMEVKKGVFKRAGRAAPRETIFDTNTSTVWIAEIAAATNRPEKCIGTHFLIPAALSPLVEIVRGADTSDETHQGVVDFLKACGKETVTVADFPGFVINRLYLPMVNEAFFALETGLATPEDIDRSCTRGLGFPLGPLAAADALGLDVLLACIKTFQRELGDKYRPAPLLVKMVKAGHHVLTSAQGCSIIGPGTRSPASQCFRSLRKLCLHPSDKWKDFGRRPHRLECLSR